MREERARIWLVVGLSAFVAATRLLAAAHSPWEWDEAQFASAVREYNIARHHPHPPGFPLYLAAAKFARLFVDDDFHALRGVSLLASMFVFPALFAFARALRFPFATSVTAALILAFLPNVWFWSGTAFSDALALALFLGAAALLLREEPSMKPYVAGSILYAGALLVRPQALLLIWPWLLGTWRRIRAGRIDAVISCAMMIAILVIGGYAVAAMASTGWSDFLEITKGHGAYVAQTDGWPNPVRPPVRTLIDDFSVDPFGAGKRSWVLFAFSIVALFPPRRRDLHVLVTFFPTLILACFYLSPTGMSRLSLSYMPMHALLAAEGIGRVAEWVGRAFPQRLRNRAVASVGVAIAAAGIILPYCIWIWPSLHEVRTRDAPSAAVAKWVLQNVPRETGKIYVHGAFTPFANYYLAGYDYEVVRDEIKPADLPDGRHTYYLGDGRSNQVQAVRFHRPMEGLYALSHRRNFDSFVIRTGIGTKFLEGWHDVEHAEDGSSWRWMTGRSRTQILTRASEVDLELRMTAPLDLVPSPTVTISIDGRPVDRFVPKSATFVRRYRLSTPGDATHDLIMEIHPVANPARMRRGSDARDLGLRLDSLSWQPVR